MAAEKHHRMGFERSSSMLETAKAVIAGGVNSNVRMWEKPHALFFESGEGPYLWDVDGNRLIDYVMGQGPMLLGHRPQPVVDAVNAQLGKGILYGAQHEAEIETAEMLVDILPSAEKLRFNMTGTEAVQAALRLARAATGRPKVLKFEGHYHGWADSVLFNVASDSSQATMTPLVKPVAESGGMAPESESGLLVAPWNDVDAVELILDEHGSALAAIIMEPIMANSGVNPPLPGYLQGVRDLCDRHGIVLIFDEVITGFRVDPGGAQSLYGITPDLTVLGKALASGFPIGCVAGREDLFAGVADGRITHAGTFNANPIGIAAAKATLSELTSRRNELYAGLRENGTRLIEGLRAILEALEQPSLLQGLPTLSALLFTKRDHNANHHDVLESDPDMLGRFLTCLIQYGVRFAGHGNLYLSATHSGAVIDETLERFEVAVRSFAVQE